ncbi:hypothetical protein B9T31_10340 [Acinetobacter sp. ANC 4558]|uniref:hypothetical protein n=1 Tax=Acinetobacter sp. ANC 4558 TaxID=1977876 RepID=UPI000A332222|nr:hypothetical protein [Acinetobacter sp. ANC 4558]OTG85979.1 hypothetical protein B9T31_10340 [Acinetobacter sp. ANC 4558]
MATKKCRKCHSEFSHTHTNCPNCGEKTPIFQKIMAWFFIILLLAAGMLWAFTDSEPDVSIDPSSNVE